MYNKLVYWPRVASIGAVALVLWSWAFFAQAFTPVTLYSGTCNSSGINYLDLSAYANSSSTVFLSLKHISGAGTIYGFWPGDYLSTSSTAGGASLVSSPSSASIASVVTQTSATGTLAYRCSSTSVIDLKLMGVNATTTSSSSSSTSTVSTTTQTVDNPALNLFLGIFIFLAVVGWIANYFSRQIHG